MIHPRGKFLLEQLKVISKHILAKCVLEQTFKQIFFCEHKQIFLLENNQVIFVVVGFIFETEIVSGEDSRFFQASLEQYVKQVRQSIEFISFLLFADQVKSN